MVMLRMIDSYVFIFSVICGIVGEARPIPLQIDEAHLAMSQNLSEDLAFELICLNSYLFEILLKLLGTSPT